MGKKNKKVYSQNNRFPFAHARGLKVVTNKKKKGIVFDKISTERYDAIKTRRKKNGI